MSAPVRQRTRTTSLPRVALAVLLAAHGLVHAMGVALLWRLGEPGSLRYADAHPTPGSTAALWVGAGWLLAGLLFVMAAALVLARRSWWRVPGAAAALLSLAVAAPSAATAAVGLVVDAVILGGIAIAAVARLLRSGPTVAP